MLSQNPSAAAKDWTQRLDRFQNADMTVTQFCKAEGVSQASYFYWRRKLRPSTSKTNTDLAESVAKFVPVSLAGTENTATEKSDTKMTVPVTTMAIELPGGILVRFEVTAGEMPQSSVATRS